MRFRTLIGITALAALSIPAAAVVGDPQVKTDHPWYPGELACSTFDRLFATQAEVFERVTGTKPGTDEQKALAGWLWRNTHYFHGEEGAEDLWGQGFGKGADTRTREYWTGLFAHGFGLCGTTHSQWTAEMEALFGHGRGRGVGVQGHNSFEVFVTGGAYGAGRWALLDHDVSTLIFDDSGKRLLSIDEVTKNWKSLTDRGYKPGKQHGWPVCGLDGGDGGVFQACNVAEYLAGYAGPPPIVRLRRGETFRRYLEPGLGNGKTFAFWGRNYNTAGVPGPERSRTWVNQPEKLFGSREGTGYHEGQARYGNAVFTYTPDFTSGDYKEGVVEEDNKHVVFEFTSPYIIAATPPNNAPWGIYDSGGRNGLVLHGKAACTVAVSTDRGTTWSGPQPFRDGLDLTDLAKGHRQYLLRFDAGAKELARSGLTIHTICQANASTMPRLKDGGTTVTFEATGRGVVSAGPNLDQAARHVVEGKMGTPRVTIELTAPRGEPALEVYAAAHVLSGNPPDPNVKYVIDLSTDGGKTWRPVVADWSVTPRGDNPPDYWSQSLCYGSLKLDEPTTGPVRVRFRNDGGRAYARCEAHLVYRSTPDDPTKVTVAWAEGGGEKQASRTFPAEVGTTSEWSIPTGKDVKTRWVEFSPAPGKK